MTMTMITRLIPAIPAALLVLVMLGMAPGFASDRTSPPSLPAGATSGSPATPETRSFFLDCTCEDCAPLPHLTRGRYWLVSRPILAGASDDFPGHVRAFRDELSRRFEDAEALSRTVVLRHRPDADAARRTRQTFLERRARQGYRVLEIDFRPDGAGAHP